MDITVTINDNDVGGVLPYWEYIVAKVGAPDVPTYVQTLIDSCGASFAAEQNHDRTVQIEAALEAGDTATAVALAQGGALTMPPLPVPPIVAPPV